jgi:uncharacterized repeat protein (TIGR04076 family)
MDIKARIISQKGCCEAGHREGDEFIIGQKTPDGMCAWAHYTLFPFAQALAFGGNFPWEKEQGTAIVACPDPDNPVVFKLEKTC